ncbi:hypothetical protein HYE67_000721 [Fusarium culmorum]|uniref:Uncharacterized protein n=1 Tax=Fusarium culmorum TaxID=5516 RepID=A0A7S8CYA0_FUSCU|nr:hypothetical protein HYE67_000721 [Fusarium culmorum]
MVLEFVSPRVSTAHMAPGTERQVFMRLKDSADLVRACPRIPAMLLRDCLLDKGICPCLKHSSTIRDLGLGLCYGCRAQRDDESTTAVTLLRQQNAHRIQSSKFIFVDSGLSVVAGSAVMDTLLNDERLGE